jgi:hypothetical protein
MSVACSFAFERTLKKAAFLSHEENEESAPNRDAESGWTDGVSDVGRLLRFARNDRGTRAGTPPVGLDRLAI